MALPIRDYKPTGQWAADADTVIPTIPIAGRAYRKIDLTETDARSGQSYDTIWESARNNQKDYEATGIAGQVSKYGIPVWTPLEDYVPGSIQLGTDEIPYRCIVANGPSSIGPQDPTATTGYWIMLASYLGGLPSGGSPGDVLMKNTNNDPVWSEMQNDFWLLKRLTGPMTIYVNWDTGNDLTADGTPAKPFKTRYAAVLYVANNFHLSIHDVTIQCTNTTSYETLNLPQYMTTLGRIIIDGAGGTLDASSFTGQGWAIHSASPNGYVLSNTVVYAPNTTSNTSCLRMNGGDVAVRNMTFVAQAANAVPIWVSGNAVLQLGDGGLGASQYSNAITMGSNAYAAINTQGGGIVSLVNNLAINGVNTFTLQCTGLAQFNRDPVTLPVISGSVSGYRYHVTVNGIANVAGGGENFFPGTLAGEKATGGQYS